MSKGRQQKEQKQATKGAKAGNKRSKDRLELEQRQARIVPKIGKNRSKCGQE